MKRFLLVVMLVLVAAAAGAAETGNRLLTADGAMYSVSVVPASDRPDVVTESSTLLLLNSRRNGETATEVVPASLTHGFHYNPTLAYESESGTLFLFWIRNNSMLFSELLVAARTPDGVWGDATTFGSPWDFRENLRIAVTRRVDDPVNGTSLPGISVHLTWWEFDTTSGKQSAKYAMVVIENGSLVSIDELDLEELVAGDSHDPNPVADGSIPVLKQPILFASRDQVLITFGDLYSGRLHRATIRPTLPPSPNGRLRVPVGRNDGGTGTPNLTVSANSVVEGMSDGSDEMALYTRDGNTLRYVLLRDGAWSAQREITLDSEMERASALEALRRLVREH